MAALRRSVSCPFGSSWIIVGHRVFYKYTHHMKLIRSLTAILLVYPSVPKYYIIGVHLGPQALSYGVLIGPQVLSYGGAHRSSSIILWR
jgi:hypothetical protein